MMRVAVATVKVPFIRGGAERLAEGLVCAMQRAGIEAEMVSTPFQFHPPSAVRSSMNVWSREDFERFACGQIDKVICLKFPTYYLQHPNKTVWLLHQHRAVYEFFDTPFGESSGNIEASALRENIIRCDQEALTDSEAIFTISKRVSARLWQYNGITSCPIYHPPPAAERFFSGAQLPYIFFPSRLEMLKRQDLLIRAMAKVRTPVMALIAGEGRFGATLEALIAELGLEKRVRLIGRVTEEEIVDLYAHSLGVFFGPIDEDLGYVTLEAMLSSKPVITCSDSGGPTEFVIDAETGFIAQANPEAVAEAVDFLWRNRDLARRLGENGRARYEELNISWGNVVQSLLA